METLPPWIHPDHPTEMTPPVRSLCEEFIRNGGVKSAAYDYAFPEANGNKKTRTAQINKHFKDERVRRYITVLQLEVGKEVVYTLAQHTSKLAEIRDAAFRDGAYAAATSAEKAIGNATGHQTAQGSKALDEHVAAPALNIQRPDRSKPAKLKAVG